MDVTLRKQDLDYLAEKIAGILKESSQQYLNTRDKARQLGIHPDTLRRAALQGRIGCEKRGDGKKARLYFTSDSRISI